MKKLILFVLILSSLGTKAQISKDSLAIIRLLEKEGVAWRKGDVKGFTDCWVARPKGRIFNSSADGKSRVASTSMMQNPPVNLMGGGGFSVHSNHDMSVSGNTAWVSHDEVSISKEGKETLSREVRLLEKIAGNWKLVGQSAHFYNRETPKTDTTSFIHTVDITNGHIETILSINKHFEAPNWHPDNYLILNSLGKIYTLDLNSKKLNLLNTGFATACNNDHGISPDKKWLVVSHNVKDDPSPKRYKSAIFILPIRGGEPRRITPEVVSYWHGWTPDGKTLAYCGERNGNYDIYTISTEGGAEKRLTDSEGLDDGPDYSPDGKYIYFNSYRTGHMQIWRMQADGSNPEQLTFDENSNWFAHPSPDGKWIAYISYMSDEKQAHLFGKQVKLRLMDVKTKEIKDLTPVFFGGQGTINVPSWSADSKKIAFVSYSVK
ncbi:MULTISPECIES: TolB family protein [Emticicia]|uniref:TolB family protein n=1 Tax=Emticicia TaxID=312278 RepID=UPI0009EE2C30|nr:MULTISPECIES: TolB family protein [Emticicia]